MPFLCPRFEEFSRQICGVLLSTLKQIEESVQVLRTVLHFSIRAIDATEIYHRSSMDPRLLKLSTLVLLDRSDFVCQADFQATRPRSYYRL